MKIKLATIVTTFILAGNSMLYGQTLGLNDSSLLPPIFPSADSGAWDQGAFAKLEPQDAAPPSAPRDDSPSGLHLALRQAQPDTTTTTTTTSSSWWGDNTGELYRPFEVNLQAYGFGTVNEYVINHLSGERIRRHAELGVGGALEVFFCKYVGIEGEAFSETTHNSFINDVGGNLKLRLPILNTGLAPYIFGGGGHEFYPEEVGYVDGGGGLEFRFCRHIGIFADARYVATRYTGNYGLGRLGVTFSF